MPLIQKKYTQAEQEKITEAMVAAFTKNNAQTGLSRKTTQEEAKNYIYLILKKTKASDWTNLSSNLRDTIQTKIASRTSI
jgi:hypothetical protein